MDKGRRVWVYCSIDAPEDQNDTLKKQRLLLCDYAEQMGFDLAGSSSDIGRKPLWQRSGFRRFVDAAIRGEADILLVANRRCLTHSSMQMAQLKALAEGCGLQVYSPLAGLMELT